MKRNIIYIRTSTDLQTPTLQLADIYSMNPPRDALQYIDQQSAWKDGIEREMFDKLVGEIKNRQIATVYVWNLDRIYRNSKKLKEFLATCRIYDVKVYSYNQQWLQELNNIPEPWGNAVFDFLLQVIAWMGENESTTKSNRVKMAVDRRANGTTYSKHGNRWGRKPLPAQTVKRVLALKDSGKSVREIAKEVLVYDKNNNGRPISKSTVQKILAQSAQEKGSKNEGQQIDQLKDKSN